MVITGNEVEELPNDCRFAVGSKLYVVNGNDGSEVYIWNSERFVLFTAKDYSPTPDEPESDIVNIGRVDYMILTE
jgi:hypothetical protein